MTEDLTLQEMQVSDTTTTGQIEKLVDYYSKLQDEIKRLEMSKEIAKGAILKAFQITGMRTFDTSSGLRARLDSSIRESIKVSEARALLSEADFNKLRHESISVILSVRAIKAGKEDG